MNKVILLLIILSACTTEKPNRAEDAANEFFDMYQARDDWQGFQGLYADDLVFEDVIYRLTFGKQEFIDFYNWPDTAFSKHPDFPATLVLEELALTDSSAIGRGYFNPFYYSGVLLSFDHRWRFNIALEFNSNGKIIRHIDFIEYPPEYLKMVSDILLKQKN